MRCWVKSQKKPCSKGGKQGSVPISVHQMHLFRCKLSLFINECSAVLLWPCHGEHSHPAWGSCAVGTAPECGCRVRLSAVPAVLNSFHRGSYAFTFYSNWFFFGIDDYLPAKNLCFHLSPIELWDHLCTVKYVSKSLSCGSYESC